MEEIIEGFRLSPQQERLWALGRTWNACAVARLEGPLDPEALRSALLRVVERHESLRTTFRLLVGMADPVQVVGEVGEGDLLWEEASVQPGVERGEALSRLLRRGEEMRFDLERGPVLLASLAALSPAEHLLLVALPALCADGASLAMLIRETAHEYAAGPGVEPPVQLIDAAEWQREILESGQGVESWRGYDRSGFSGWRLPFERRGTDAPAPEAWAAVELSFGPEEVHQAEELAAACGAPPAAFFLLAWQILLGRLALLSRVVVGTTFDGRSHEELQEVLGPLGRALPVSCDLAGDGSFRSLLRAAGTSWHTARAWQEAFSWDRLPGEAARGFHAGFRFEERPPGHRAGPLTISLLKRQVRSEPFAFELACESAGDRLEVRLHYSPAVLLPQDAERLARLYRTLVASALTSPDARFDELALLAPEERPVPDREAAAASAPWDGGLCLHQHFAQWAARRPDSPAVTWKESSLTYGELERRANQLARHLRGLGVGPEVLVGLCVERSAELVIGLLGILKAGGGYVPLDPDYPQERLAFAVEDAGLSVLVTEERLAARLPGRPDLTLVRLDADREFLEREATEAPEDHTTPGNVAYVIYTSGSTGRPKGVVVPHAQAVRLFPAARPWLEPGASDVWTLFHSVSFDFSVWEIWGALAHGGRLVVVPYWISRSPESFYELLARERVTVLSQTPSAFRQLVHAEAVLPSPPPLALRAVVFGGEALEMASLAPWFERHGDERPMLINMYGITETTVHVTARPVRVEDVEGGSVVGQPLADLQVHLLDRGMSPVPPYVPGEIFVGGAGLARGYLNRPDLTAERFVPDPFSTLPGERLYRSGDQARLLPGAPADLEYLGRIDQQVKIRGFRIEPGEIEAALSSHPAVREAAVVARDGEDGPRLVAYVVPAGGQAPSASELREILGRRLPDHMIPAAFVSLAALPLTPNGKLDRHALPEPGRPAASEGFVPAFGPEEEVLAAIWAQVLGVEPVGMDDNFFALGGDSIRSIQVRSRAEAAGLPFSVQTLFQSPTVRALARELRRSSDVAQASLQVPPFGLLSEEDRQRLPQGIEDAYPLARLQAGMLFHSEYSPESAVYHDLFSFHLRGPLDLPALRAAWQGLAAGHPVLRTSFDLSTFSEPLQLVHRQAEVPIGMTDLRSLSSEEQEAAIDAWLEREKRQPFDWRRPPLLRIEIHWREERAFQLSAGFHHAILDGWSLASLLSELFRRYLFLIGGEGNPVEGPPETTYRDFVAAERLALATEETRRFWEGVVHGGPRTSLLNPAARPEAGGPEIRQRFVPLPAEVSEGLKRLAREAGVPLKSVLLAAHLRALSFLTGEPEVTTGLVSNGRLEEEGGERVLGLFLNTLPLRLRLGGGSWLDLVRETFATERSLLPHRRFPLAEMQRMAGGQPLFETVFNFIHFHVYQGLAGLQGIEVVSREGFEEANFPFAAVFSLAHAEAPLQLRFDYRADLLAEELLGTAARVYERALSALAASPRSRYEHAPLLSPEERLELQAAGRGTEGPGPLASVHDLFAAVARQSPEAVALAFGEERIAYRELEARANRLARHLIRLGVGPEVLVGLCLRRSPDLLTGMLGVLKAGGAYVPLDPQYPAERLALLLADSQADLLVSEEAAFGAVSGSGLPAVLLDRDRELLARENASELPSRSGPDHPAYVVYTSGSTGTPKGVVARHGSLANFSRAVVDAVGLGPGHRMLQFASPSFDASALQIFPTLISGATLVLHPDPAGLSSEEILRLCLDQGVTVLDLPGALWRQWVETMAAAGDPLPGSIAVYMTGGEKLPAETLRQWGRLAPESARFISSYGPTEATVTTTFLALERRDAGDFPAVSPPLGRPLPAARLRLLDPHLEPVPAGVPGELYIGGAGLARGYLRRPELTAERFIPDPLCGEDAEPGARLYRTGDQARWSPQGGFEFLGRTDHQVKIRGFRVEPGEVETALARHPAVREAVVLARGDASGAQRLIAYVLPGPGPAPTVPELREFLGRSLPDPMVPSVFVALDSLPLLPSGKIDRSALPEPETVRPDLGDRYLPPRNPVEEIVAGIWARVLGVEKVGVFDNFFELGGHSLLATQTVTRIRQTFEIDLELRQLFEAPTVAGLVEALLADPARRNPVERTAALMVKLAGLSDEEVEAMLLEGEESAAEERSL